MSIYDTDVFTIHGVDGLLKAMGTAKPFVLLIEFPDQRRLRFITAMDIENSLFDIENKDSLSAYTLVIPANILSSKNPAVTNNYNSIWGFITE